MFYIIRRSMTDVEEFRLVNSNWVLVMQPQFRTVSRPDGFGVKGTVHDVQQHGRQSLLDRNMKSKFGPKMLAFVSSEEYLMSNNTNRSY